MRYHRALAKPQKYFYIFTNPLTALLSRYCKIKTLELSHDFRCFHIFISTFQLLSSGRNLSLCWAVAIDNMF